MANTKSSERYESIIFSRILAPIRDKTGNIKYQGFFEKKFFINSFIFIITYALHKSQITKSAFGILYTD